MKTTTLAIRAAALLLLISGALRAQVPPMLHHQGRLAVNHVNFDGTGQFKFALVDAAGTATYWGNDGTSTAGSQPTNAVSLTVTTGLYSVLLGDTSLPNMTAIPHSVFSHSDVRLRVWFNDGTTGFQLLAPDQRIAAAGYAMMAANFTGAVPDSQLSPNIPWRDANQSFTGVNLFSPPAGEPPFAVGSALKVSNLNADLLDGVEASAFMRHSDLCVDNTGELKALPPGEPRCVLMLGYHTPGDGGGGHFYWDSAAAEPENGGTVFEPVPPLLAGRWKRIHRDRLSVRDFGAAGDGIVNDGPAVRAAAAAIPAEGGVLYFPPGEYKLNSVVRSEEPYTIGVELKPRTMVLGSGSGSVVKADGNLSMLLAQGVSQIRISNLSFVIDVMGSTANNFTTVLNFDSGVSDLVVESCRFEAVNVPPNEHLTLHAVLAKGVKRLWVTNNEVHQMQIKTGADSLESGFNVMGPAVITNNYFHRPRNWALTAVHFTDPTEILDLIIANNVIEDPAGEGGIAVGTDSDSHRIESLKRMVIRGNIIKGRWTNQGDPGPARQAIGILVRAGRQSEQILIDGNTISKDGNEPPLELLGIKIDVCTQPTTMKSLTIANNSVSHGALAGIMVAGDQELEGLVILGNTLEQTGGIAIRRGVIREGIVTANVVRGGGGLHLKTVRDGDRIGPILVRDNVFNGSPGDGILLDAAVPNTILRADVLGNRCSNNQYGIHEIGPDEGGEGTYDTRYFDNDLRDNVNGGLKVSNVAPLRDNRE